MSRTAIVRRPGAKAVEGLRPILGLELTATPQVVQGSRATPFRNVAFNYPLGNAIRDELVKEPAVATRADFVPSALSEEALERLKLEDGLLLHERTKVQLEAYATERNERLVKPFTLIVAESTAHADELQVLIESAEFLDGRYAGKVTVVHSNQSGEIKDDNLARLLNVERADEPTEIVIHVNKLGEGWDVTNLYTLIPLRAANSPNLVEQSLGRGLRLPYGRRTGVEAVDTLTVVSHDRFQAIIDHANRPGSAVQAFRPVLIDERTSTPLEVVRVRPLAQERIAAAPELTSDADRTLARVALEIATEPGAEFTKREIQTAEGQQRLVKAVMERIATTQIPLALDGAAPDATAAVGVVARELEGTIAIPRIALVPKDGKHGTFRRFALDVRGIRRQPVDQQIVVQALQSHERRLVAAGLPGDVGSPEDVIVRELARDSAISYDRYAELLYDLAGQLTTHLRSYLPDDEAVRNVVATQSGDLAELIRAQMLEHRDDGEISYDAIVSGDVHVPRELSGTSAVNADVLYFGNTVDDLSRIRLLWFSGFRRCLFGRQRFQSDTERRMAALLERDPGDGLLWYKPANEDLKIWLRGGAAYNPDFVVEAKDAKFLIETKADNEMASPDVVEKATAARLWCEHASRWEEEHGGKPWRYLLVPDSAVTASATLAGLASRYG
jgi:type III restriction enzyme